MTSTDYEKETYKIYELQDRLAATIKYFSGVRDATVTSDRRKEQLCTEF
jgi:flagellar M-ring protein FliF